MTVNVAYVQRILKEQGNMSSIEQLSIGVLADRIVRRYCQ